MENSRGAVSVRGGGIAALILSRSILIFKACHQAEVCLLHSIIMMNIFQIERDLKCGTAAKNMVSITGNQPTSGVRTWVGMACFAFL